MTVFLLDVGVGSLATWSTTVCGDGGWTMMIDPEVSEHQAKILERFVTNTTDNVFVLRNLPEVIKGALFSRYSRSTLGLRALLLKEFILEEATSFKAIVGDPTDQNEQMIAIQKAQNFYDRILDGYGDDSIGELGGAHLAIESVSMLGAKVVEDGRIGGSPLEKSTRYIYFDQKVKGHYLFYREPVLMTSAYRELFEETCNELFETYSRLIPPLTSKIEGGFPKDPAISKGAYVAALRAKVLDCLRGLLPASTLTNMGVFGNGRFFESLLQRMGLHNLVEMQEIAKKARTELNKVIPSFIRRSDPDHKHYQGFAAYFEALRSDTKQLALHFKDSLPQPEMQEASVRLIDFDPTSPHKVAAAILFSSTQQSLQDLRSLSQEDVTRILEVVVSAREHRRHKSPRALEQASFTFEIVADFGVYRDLQRHRILSQERQPLTCDLGYYTPPEIVGMPEEKLYHEAMAKGKKAYDTIANELPEEAQYVVPMGYHIRWYFHVNLRSLQWLSELRSQAAGHPMYRWIAQEMARQVSEAIPSFERFFKFVDFDGYSLGRLSAEVRSEAKVKGGS